MKMVDTLRENRETTFRSAWETGTVECRISQSHLMMQMEWRHDQPVLKVLCEKADMSTLQRCQLNENWEVQE